jgi:hypothetical protein
MEGTKGTTMGNDGKYMTKDAKEENELDLEYSQALEGEDNNLSIEHELSKSSSFSSLASLVIYLPSLPIVVPFVPSIPCKHLPSLPSFLSASSFSSSVFHILQFSSNQFIKFW